MYKYYIQQAANFWIRGKFSDAIESYEKALNEKQSGSITKKSLLENIEELKNELKSNL